MVGEPVERIKAQRHQWSADSRTHLPLRLLHPPPPMSTPAPSHTPRTPWSPPPGSPQSPSWCATPPPSRSSPTCCAQKTNWGVGWGNRAPSLAEPPCPPIPQACTPSTGLESSANRENEAKICHGIRREHPERKGDLRQEDARICRMS